METASRQLQLKFEGARALLEKASQVGADAAVATEMSTELASLEARFALSTAHLHILALRGETGRLSAAAEFSRILAVEDFAGEIDRLVARSEAAFRAAGVPLREENTDLGIKGRRGRGRGRGGSTRGRGAGAARGALAKPSARPPANVCAEIQRLLDTYPRGDRSSSDHGAANLAGGSAQQIDFERCACGGDMATDAGRSELRCGECSAVRELVGTVFDDSQFYSQEGQKAKSGTFNPNRHFQHWWTHILAREPEEEIGDKDDPENMYGEKLLERLRTIVTRDHKILRMLTVNDGRTMLREEGRTDLNKNVPLILKKLTGVGPPSPPDSIAVRVENIFTKAIEIGERVRRNGRVNRNYYPFYIFKIVDRIIPEADVENRRILYYIYVQSKETVEADDAEWEQICLELPEIEYVPTDRSLGLKYAPS